MSAYQTTHARNRPAGVRATGKPPFYHISLVGSQMEPCHEHASCPESLDNERGLCNWEQQFD